jgi:putative addiction module component (TIGR02574 family)
VSTQQLPEELLARPLSERAEAAQSLWASLGDAEAMDVDEAAAIAEAKRRYEELKSGAAASYTHEEVMAAARRALG